jgi:hypothetical protein
VPPVSYTVHGLCVRSDLPLPLALASNHAQPDVEVVRAAGVPVPDEPPRGESYGSVGEPPARGWWSLDGEAWRIRFGGRCELRIAPAWRRIDVDVDPDAPAGVVGDRVVKTGVAFALERSGHHMLHASAVDLDGLTIALAGAPGAGKSTLAALLCADGGTLVSDDQLRVELEVDSDAVICHPGLEVIRLRSPMRHVAARLGDRVSQTWDGRTAVSPTAVVGPRRLNALVLPEVVEGLEAVGLHSLAPSQAMLALAGTRSLPGITRWISERFHLHASLAERLPALSVKLPRGRVPTEEERTSLVARLRGCAAA